jgi:hypothetical protein
MAAAEAVEVVEMKEGAAVAVVDSQLTMVAAAEEEEEEEEQEEEQPMRRLVQVIEYQTVVRQRFRSSQPAVVQVQRWSSSRRLLSRHSERQSRWRKP